MAMHMCTQPAFKLRESLSAALQESTYTAPPDTVYKVSSPVLQSIPAFTRRWAMQCCWHSIREAWNS